MGYITELIRAAAGGDRSATEQLYAKLYRELRQLARARLRDGGRDAVLDTSAVVHDGFLRMVEAGSIAAQDRHQFLAYAARAMRSVVIDAVRERRAIRRGGDVEIGISLHEERVEATPRPHDDLLRVNQALERLEAADPEAAHIVEMRFFGGLEMAEIASALGVSASTVERRWRRGRAFLYAALS